MKKEINDQAISFTISKKLKEAIVKAAKKQKVSQSEMLRIVLTGGLIGKKVSKEDK